MIFRNFQVSRNSTFPMPSICLSIFFFEEKHSGHSCEFLIPLLQPDHIHAPSDFDFFQQFKKQVETCSHWKSMNFCMDKQNWMLSQRWLSDESSLIVTPCKIPSHTPWRCRHLNLWIPSLENAEQCLDERSGCCYGIWLSRSWLLSTVLMVKGEDKEQKKYPYSGEQVPWYSCQIFKTGNIDHVEKHW